MWYVLLHLSRVPWSIARSFCLKHPNSSSILLNGWISDTWGTQLASHRVIRSEKAFEHNPEEKYLKIFWEMQPEFDCVDGSFWALCHCSPLPHRRFGTLFAGDLYGFLLIESYEIIWNLYFEDFWVFFHVLPCFPLQVCGVLSDSCPTEHA